MKMRWLNNTYTNRCTEFYVYTLCWAKQNIFFLRMKLNKQIFLPVFIACVFKEHVGPIRNGKVVLPEIECDFIFQLIFNYLQV